MATILQVLSVILPYLAVLYVLDSLTFVGSHQLIFVSHFGRSFGIRKPGLCLTSLSPLGQTIAVSTTQACLSSSGIYLVSKNHLHQDSPRRYEREAFRFIPYANVARLELTGSNVQLNDTTEVQTPSVFSARLLIERIQRLKDASYAERQQLIASFMHEETDAKKVILARRAFMNPLFYMKLFCSLLFVNLFVILPVALYTSISAFINITALFIVILVLYAGIVTFSAHLVGKMYPKEPTVKWQIVLTIILSPVAAMHVVSYLTRHLFASFDPLALGSVLLPPNAFRSWMREELVLIGKACEQDDGFGWAEFWQLKKEALHQLIIWTGNNWRDFLAPPVKQDLSAASYCPLCQAEYRTGFSECSDCGIELEHYENRDDRIIHVQLQPQNCEDTHKVALI